MFFFSSKKNTCYLINEYRSEDIVLLQPTCETYESSETSEPNETREPSGTSQTSQISDTTELLSVVSNWDYCDIADCKIDKGACLA